MKGSALVLQKEGIMSKYLIYLGIFLIILGLLLPYLDKIGLGRLPGDFFIQKGSFTFYFPFMSSLLISLVLSFLLWFLNR